MSRHELPSNTPLSAFDSNAKKNCPRCKNTYPNGTEFHFVEHSEVQFGREVKVVELQIEGVLKRGYMVCPTCNEYYELKAKEIKHFFKKYRRMPNEEEVETIRRNISAALRGETQAVQEVGTATIRKNISAAQRGEIRAVQGVGSGMMGPPTYVPIHAIPSGRPVGNFGGERFRGPERSPCHQDIADRHSAVNGYTRNHVWYSNMKTDQIRQHLIRNRNTLAGNFHANVEVKYYPLDSNKPCNIPLVIGALEYVPKDISYLNLRGLLFKFVLEGWEKYRDAKGFQITDADFEMNKYISKTQLAPLLPTIDDQGRDIGCLTPFFEPTPLSKAKRTTAKPKADLTLTIVFVMKLEKYLEYEAWLSGRDNLEAQDDYIVQSPKVLKTPRRKSKRRAVTPVTKQALEIEDSDEDDSQLQAFPSNATKAIKSQSRGQRSASIMPTGEQVIKPVTGQSVNSNASHTPTPPPRSESIPLSKRGRESPDNSATPPRKRRLGGAGSPEAKRILRALRGSSNPSKADVKKIFKHEELKVSFFPCKELDLLEVVSISGESHFEDILEEQAIDVVLRMERADISEPKYGAVKMMRKAELATPVKVDSGAFSDVMHVAVKQAFEARKRSDGRIERMPFPGDGQLVALAPELTCLAWAKALYASTMTHVRRVSFMKESNSPTVPEMRFVECALAKELGGAKNSYLIEEYIDEKKGGKFVKYIHNSTSAIHDMPEEYAMRARFLAFAQHHQYWKTLKLAYISDLQGNKDLLTDPQIITNPRAKAKFASGNMASTFSSFEETHKCNEYCAFFDIPSNYNKWDTVFDESEDENEEDAAKDGEQGGEGNAYVSGKARSDMSISVM